MFGFSTVLGSYSHVIDGKNDSLVRKMIFRWWEDEKKTWRSEPRGGESEIKPFSERGLFFFWFPCSFLLALWLFVISRLISITCLERTFLRRFWRIFFSLKIFRKYWWVKLPTYPLTTSSTPDQIAPSSYSDWSSRCNGYLQPESISAA